VVVVFVVKGCGCDVLLLVFVFSVCIFDGFVMDVSFVVCELVVVFWFGLLIIVCWVVLIFDWDFGDIGGIVVLCMFLYCVAFVVFELIGFMVVISVNCYG